MRSATALTALFAATAFAYPPDFLPNEFSCLRVDPVSDVVDGDAWQDGETVDGGGSVQVSASHTVTNTWTIGGDLGIGIDEIIKKIVSASIGISGSVAKGVSDAGTTGISAPCPPGPWRCQALVYPGTRRITGTVVDREGTDCPKGTIKQQTHKAPPVGSKFENIVPISNKDGNGSFRAEACACKNWRSWADNGAPTTVCPEQCA